MSTMTTSNGRPQRKQLSDQLDRLDGIIDALADGLNQAVVTAAKDGTRSAVKEILTELLTNPDILAMISASAGPLNTSVPVSQEPGNSTIASPSIVGLGRHVASAIKETAMVVAATVGAKVQSIAKNVTSTALAIWHSPLFNRAVVIGVGIGLATAVVASSNPTLTAIVGGVAAAATAVTVQVGGWFRAAGRSLGLV